LSDELGNELAGGLSELRAAAGIEETEGSQLRAKTVRVTLPIDDLCNRITAYLAAGGYGLYRRGQDIGTVDALGNWETMDARSFRTWLPDECKIIPIEKAEKTMVMNDETGRLEAKKDSDGRVIWKPIKGELTLDQAATVLRNRTLRLKLPLLEHINRVKLPVMRAALDAEGRRKIELLKPGYDAESRTLTLDNGFDYDENLDPNEGLKFIKNLLRWFPWADATPEDVSGRSVAIQVAACLTVYCARMFRGRSPLFLWNANLPDSGKSRLAQLAIQPVHGHAARAGFSYRDKKETRQELDGVAQSFGPYIFFDDIPRGKIVNEDLHRWLTAPEWACRILGTKDLFRGPLYAASMMTGNEIKLNDDLERRALQIDLHSRVQGRDRVLPDCAILLDDDFFADDGRMAEVLSALWSLVRWWNECGRPGTKRRPLNSFESWSRVVPAVVECCKFGDCLAPFDAPDSGNEEGREIRKLMTLVLDRLPRPRPSTLPPEADDVTMVELFKVTALAREAGLFQEKLLTIEAIIEAEGEKGGWKFKELKPEEDKIIKAAARLQLVSEGNAAPDDYDTNERATLLARRESAAQWHGAKIGSWWGKYFKKRAADGLLWKNSAGETFSVGSRANVDLSKVALTRLGVGASLR